MGAYQMLVVAAAVGTYLLIVVGAIVRVTGSGLGCPDWPTCHGQWVPPLEPAALIEYTHRLLGALVSPLILAVAVGAWLTRRRARGVVLPATLAPLLLAIQIVLGAVVVRLELPAMVVLVHLAFAMLILGLLVWTAVLAGRASAAESAATSRPASFVGLVHATATAIFVLVLVGAYVRATGAGWACVGFPDCNGEALPFGSSRLVDLHLLHRLLAYAVAGLAGAVAVAAWRHGGGGRAVPLVATLLGALVVAQIGIGAIGVTTGLPAVVRGFHVAGAAAVWATAVVLAALVARLSAPAHVGDTGIEGAALRLPSSDALRG